MIYIDAIHDGFQDCLHLGRFLPITQYPDYNDQTQDIWDFIMAVDIEGEDWQVQFSIIEHHD